MQFFGSDVSLIVFLQALVTVLAVAIYAAMTSAQERRDTHLSNMQMLLLTAYVTANHATKKTLQQLFTLTDEQLKKEGSDLKSFAERQAAFDRSGEIPVEAKAPSSSLGQHILALLLAPLFGIASCAVAYVEFKNRTYLTAHTEYRKNFVSKVIIFAAAIGILAALLAHFAPGSPGDLTMFAIGLLVVAMLCSIGTIAVLALQQRHWKDFWLDRVLEVLATAAHSKRQDVFAQGQAFYLQIESQPDLPVPGRLGAYTAVFSAVQGVILLLAKWVSPV